MVIELKNFVNGEFPRWQPTSAAKFVESVNPATGEVFARVPDSGEAEVNAAVEAASNAFESWSKTPASKRALIMNKIADLIEAHLEELAQLESSDQGKPLSLARAMDIPRAIYNFRFFASGASSNHAMEAANYQDEAGALNYTKREPVGVVALITPSNSPLYLLTSKIAPCIASGCTCVCKPSELTSATAFRLAELMAEAGLPKGVVNMVFGTGPRSGEPLIKHSRVAAISFTGSTRVGQRIRELTAASNKKLSLEMGGKNAALVFADADVDAAAAQSARSAFLNQGETRLSTSRILVHQSIYDRFLERFVAAARAMRVGDPKEPTTQVGALVSAARYAKVRSYIDYATTRGGETRVMCGAPSEQRELEPALRRGFFVPPTVIVGVPDDDRLTQDEMFGPVATVSAFNDEDEAVRRANYTENGLCATVWTQDVKRAHRVAHQLDVGTVWINCWLLHDSNMPSGGMPYGSMPSGGMPHGGMKQSSLGREGWRESLQFFTDAKTICVKL